MKTLQIILILILMISSLKSQTERKAEDAEGLSVGTIAPVFTAIDADSNIFSLEEAIIKEPVVLIFYRGFWCPVCN